MSSALPNNLTAQPVVVWQFDDGKPGHSNQCRGLIRALERRLRVEDHVVPVAGRFLLSALFSGKGPAERTLPDPALILGAGHRTHYWLVLARLWRGGRSVVLMRPTLPASWFDLCVLSDHDRPKRSCHPLVVRGVLNAVAAGGRRDSREGLFLIGGPCRHAVWDNEKIVRQLSKITATQPNVTWSLTTSRRTPARFLELLSQRPAANLLVRPFEQTERDWVPNRLASAAQVWVTPDSVSMVYESLTAGAATGLLDLTLERQSKLVNGLEGLVREGYVRRFSEESAAVILSPPRVRLDEAGRCAEWICRNWFGNHAEVERLETNR